MNRGRNQLQNDGSVVWLNRSELYDAKVLPPYVW